jgi:hypothetical protein
MTKYYEVEAVNKILEDLFNEPEYQHKGETFYVGVATVKQELLGLSTVELDTNKKGKWTYKGNYPTDNRMFECSVCGKWAKEDSKYCPHCSTPMDIGGAIT